MMEGGIKRTDRRSAHNPFFRQAGMRELRGVWTSGNGSEIHKFDFVERRTRASRVSQKALVTIQAYLVELGFALDKTDDNLNNLSELSFRTRTYSNGSEVVRLTSYIGYLEDFERIRTIDHFPAGTAGDGRSRLTISDVINAMTWGN